MLPMSSMPRRSTLSASVLSCRTLLLSALRASLNRSLHTPSCDGVKHQMDGDETECICTTLHTFAIGGFVQEMGLCRGGGPEHGLD